MADKHRRFRAAAITGVGQLLGLLGSTLIGVLVAGTLPPSPRIDSFFAANQIYALALYLGQSVRITAPALMVRAGVSQGDLERGTHWLAAGTAAFMVIVAVFAPALVAEPSRDAFTKDLIILAPAAALHVEAGALAARLSIHGSFGRAAAAYAAGSIVSGLLLLGTIDAYGAAALAPCISAGGLTVGIVMLTGFRRYGKAGDPVPEFGDVAGLGAMAPASVLTSEGEGVDRGFTAVHPGPAFALRRIGLGSVWSLSMQFLIAVFTLAAGHIVAGGTALLSYSFLALFAFTTIAITPMSIVLGPEVAERWNGQPQALASMIRQATRLSVVFAVPMIVLAFLLGRPLAGILLPALSDADLTRVFDMLAVLSPTLLFTAAATAATVGIIAADRLGTLASVLVAICAPLAIAGVVLVVIAPSLIVVAMAAAIFAFAFAVGALVVAVGRYAWPTLSGVVVENLPVALPPLVATAVLSPLVQDDVALGALVCIPVVALHLGIVAWLRGDVLGLVVGAVRRRTTA